MTSSIRIRTSEDVRASKKDEVCFYLLAQGFAGYLMQPLLLFACEKRKLAFIMEFWMEGNFWKVKKKESIEAEIQTIISQMCL